MQALIDLASAMNFTPGVSSVPASAASMLMGNTSAATMAPTIAPNELKDGAVARAASGTLVGDAYRAGEDEVMDNKMSQRMLMERLIAAGGLRGAEGSYSHQPVASQGPSEEHEHEHERDRTSETVDGNAVQENGIMVDHDHGA